MNKEELRKFIKEQGYSLVDFSKDIALYMGVEWSEKIKERVYQLLSPKGTGKPTQEEEDAITFWCDVEKNPHKYAYRYYVTKDLTAKIKGVSDWILGRRSYTRLQAKKMVDYLNRLL